MIIYLPSRSHYFPFRIASPTLTVTHSHCSGSQRRPFISLTEENVWSSPALRPLNVKLLWRSDVRRRASPNPRGSICAPRVNGPQGQTQERRIKPGGINYSGWRRLSAADKCVLQFHSCLFAAIQAEGRGRRSALVHYRALYLLKWADPFETNAIQYNWMEAAARQASERGL